MGHYIILFINKRRYMKRKLLIIFLVMFVFVFSGSNTIYGGYWPPVFKYDPAYDIVFIEDVYYLNERYQKEQSLDKKEAREILVKCSQKYANIDIDSSQWTGTVCCGVVGEEGYMDYMVCNYEPSSSSNPDVMLLMSSLTGQVICLNEPAKVLEKFIERNNRIARKAREQYFYVRNHLQEDEYGGIYYDYEKEKVCVMLVDESKASLLDAKRIQWEKTEVSRNQLYDKLQYLWQERERLNIANVRMNVYDDTLVICTFDNEEEFRRKLGDSCFERDIYFLAESRDIINQKTIVEYLENKKKVYLSNESFWQKMEDCLEELTTVYTEYSLESIYTLVFRDCDYNKYIAFEKELEEFTVSIPYHENQKNPFDEERYGDPKQLALKVMLTEYKTVYPEMSYQELYEKYGKEINESKILTQEEKRSRYLWESVKAEQLRKEDIQEQKADRESYAPAAVGIAVLIAGEVIMVIMKRKSCRNTAW